MDAPEPLAIYSSREVDPDRISNAPSAAIRTSGSNPKRCVSSNIASKSEKGDRDEKREEAGVDAVDLDTTDDKYHNDLVDIEKQAPPSAPTGQATTANTGPLAFALPGPVDGDDQNLVWWDGDDDPANPYNWSTPCKVLACGLISYMTFLTPLASSMFAPGVSQLMDEFGSDSRTMASFCVSVYVLGFAAGPLVFAPLSEIYGRTAVYHGANVGFLAFVLACALAPSLDSLVAFRFFSGLFGSCPLTNGGGTIADVIVQERRGAAMAVYSVGPILGPILGPVAGGFLAEARGWRWTFWVLLILASFSSVALFVCLRESYAPVLLARKAARLRVETGNQALRSRLDNGLSPRDHFLRGIVRPLRLITRSPVCIVVGLYTGIVYSFQYLLFTTITPIFIQIYNFSISTGGLAFLGLGIGNLIAVLYFLSLSDRYIKRKSATADAAAVAAGREPEGMKPEYRLPLLRAGAIVLPVGMFIYGWTAEYRVHWAVPIFGMLLVGFGNMVVFMAFNVYLIDSFTIFAASALATNVVTRSILGAFLPLAGFPMYDSLGIGWGNSLLGFLAAAMVPLAFIAEGYGEQLRKKFVIKDL